MVADCSDGRRIKTAVLLNTRDRLASLRLWSYLQSALVGTNGARKSTTYVLENGRVAFEGMLNDQVVRETYLT